SATRRRLAMAQRDRLPAGGGAMRRSFIVMVAVLACSGSAGAQNLRHVYRTAPSLVGLPSLAEDGRYQNAADVILEQAIRNLPLHPAASSPSRTPCTTTTQPSSGWTTPSRRGCSPSAARRWARACSTSG